MPKTNAAPPNNYIARLQNAIRQLNRCESKYVATVFVSEHFLSFHKKRLWQGEVAIFEIYGHTQAQRAYAWSNTVGDNDTRYVVVLETPPINSPETAVQAAIAAQIVNGSFR
jgi:hypothetical protein